jgi:hypothetical protein
MFMPIKWHPYIVRHRQELKKNLGILRIIATQGMWRVADGVIEVHSKAD